MEKASEIWETAHLSNIGLWGYVEKEHLYTVGGNINCATTLENSMEFPQKPCDSAIPLLSIYPKKKKTLIRKDPTP